MVSLAILALFVTLPTVAMGFLGLPSPVLFGSLVGGLLYSVSCKREISLPSWSFWLGQSIVGVIVGSIVDWESLRDLGGDWPAVVLVSLATLVVSILLGQLLLVHSSISRVTATFSSVAGGASGMVALAHDMGADDRVVVVVQYLRVLVILLAMPVAVALAFGAKTHGGAEIESADRSAVWGSLLVGVAIISGLVLAKLLRLPSPAVLGAMLAAMLWTLTPSFSGAAVPLEIQNVGFLLIGVQVGLKFTLQSIRSISGVLPTAFLVIVLIVATCAGLGRVLALVTGVSPLDGYLATTPGGLYAVLSTSTATGGDVTFVTAVQLIRMLMVIIPAPFISRAIANRRGRPT